MNKKVLECIDISKRIGHQLIVNDVSFSLYEGDILGFIGPNGAGKTTTIKLLLGLQSLSSGSVRIMGFNIRDNFEKAIRNVGAIIESADLYMYLSGYDNLKIVADLYGISRDRIMEVVRLVGLEKSIDKEVRKYSLGMRQRLGIAQAILHKPSILILDEPMNGLDPIGIRELKRLLIYLANKERVAIVISSHILSELEDLVNRVCIMYNGSIVRDTTYDEIGYDSNNINYIIEVDNINLDNIIYNYEVIDDKHIRVYSSLDNINDILRTLLLNNINILGLRREVLSLENIFMESTINNDKVN